MAEALCEFNAAVGVGIDASPPTRNGDPRL
jgi:hypothetical protein